MKIKNKVVMVLAGAAAFLSGGFGQSAHAETNPQDDLKATVKACLGSAEAKATESQDDLASVLAACLTKSGRALMNASDGMAPSVEDEARIISSSSGGSTS